MDLAVRTTASPAAIWAICLVAVACLAFWLSMVMVVANRPDPRRRLPELTGSVLGGIHMAAGGRSVAPTRHEAAATEADLAGARAGQQDLPQVPAQRGPRAPAEPVQAGGTGTSGASQAETPAEPIPGQRFGGDDRTTAPRGS